MGAENGEESDNGTNGKQELAIKNLQTAFNKLKLAFSNNSHYKQLNDIILQLGSSLQKPKASKKPLSSE